MEYIVRHGIKLFKRKCLACKDAILWVPRSSPQRFCSEECRIDTEGHKRKGIWPYARKKRKVAYQLIDEDYDNDQDD